MATVKKQQQLYTRFAQVGRVVLIQYGPDAGKLATIVDMVDQTRALIDGPANITGVKRQLINFKWIALTDYVLAGEVEVDGAKRKIALGRGARQATLTKFWNLLKIKDKFDASSWGKRIAAKKAKATSTDFSRFTAKVAKQSKAKAVRAKL